MTYKGYINWGFGSKTQDVITACGEGNHPTTVGRFERFQGDPAKYAVYDHAGNKLSPIFGFTQEEGFRAAVDAAIRDKKL